MSDRPGRIPAEGRIPEAAWAALFLGVATLLLTYPIAAHLRDGMADLWDAKLNAWILHWDFHQTFRDPRHLFDANIFHPARYALAFSENLFGVALFGFPLYASGMSTLAAYNVLFLLGMFLSALSAWALAREVTQDAAASLLAGVVYAFVPWRFSQLPHLQHQWGAFLALLLLFLLRFLDSGRRRDLLLFGVCFAWNALANVHYAFFSGALLAVVLLWELATGSQVSRRRIPFVLLASAAAGALVAPFYLPYAQASRLYGMTRSFHEMEWFSGRPVGFLSAGVYNKLYGTVTQRFSYPEGDFFPGLVPVALAILAFRRLRRPSPLPGTTDQAAPVRPIRRRLAICMDVALVVILVLFVAAELHPGLRLGPVRMADPGRLVVWAVVAMSVRLSLAFPRRSRFRYLADFLKSRRLDRRALLLAAISVAGVLVALGAHTPFYRFLFDSLGFLFEAIRAPSRGIVLFHLALAVLSAWGLSRLAGPQASWRRRGIVAGALVLVGVEYRAFPLRLHPVDPQPAPVYRWLADAPIPGGIVEWPLAQDFDFEYEFRSTAHWKPIVNGASGFSPPGYLALWALLQTDPIPNSVWAKARGLDVSLLIFHPHGAPGRILARFGEAAARGLSQGSLEILRALPHGEETDYVFRLTSAPRFDAASPEEKRDAAERFASIVLRPEVNLSRPFGSIDFPPADFEVAPGDWVYGWAIDDSGIREIRVSSELGPVGIAGLGGARTDVGKMFPGYPDSARSGFGFQVPPLPVGRHTLILRIVAKDGGEKILNRPVRVRRSE